MGPGAMLRAPLVFEGGASVLAHRSAARASGLSRVRASSPSLPHHPEARKHHTQPTRQPSGPVKLRPENRQADEDDEPARAGERHENEADHDDEHAERGDQHPVDDVQPRPLPDRRSPAGHEPPDGATETVRPLQVIG